MSELTNPTPPAPTFEDVEAAVEIMDGVTGDLGIFRTCCTEIANAIAKARAEGARLAFDKAIEAVGEYGKGCQRGPKCERCDLVRWITTDINAARTTATGTEGSEVEG